MSSGPQLIRPAEPRERNWLPLAIAAAVVLVTALGLLLVYQHGKSAPTVTPIGAPLASYASHLAISGLAMSQSANYMGGRFTYIDGRIVNTGGRTVTGITVQVLFRGYTNMVTQNETQPLKFIRIRQPYIDVEPVSAAPLNPGAARDFRLIFDEVSQDWNGAYPEVRIVRVETK
ncbi:MAG: DUF2393 family protein [Terracidiphilus sp.]